MNAIKSQCYALIQQIAVRKYPMCKWEGCHLPSTEGHHLFKRDRMATAFLSAAVWGVCHGHHEEAHRKSSAFAAMAVREIGEGAYYELQRLSHSTLKIDIKKVRKDLRKELTSLAKLFK